MIIFSEKAKLTINKYLSLQKTNRLTIGGVGTYRSSMIFNVKRGIGIIVLGNAIGRRSANVHYLAKLLYSEIRRNKLNTNKK